MVGQFEMLVGRYELGAIRPIRVIRRIRVAHLLSLPRLGGRLVKLDRSGIHLRPQELEVLLA